MLDACIFIYIIAHDSMQNVWSVISSKASDLALCCLLRPICGTGHCWVKWAASSEFGTYRLCEQRRFRRACASAHTSSESRGTFRLKARSLAPLNGWACAVKICHDGMLEDTKSLDGAQMLHVASVHTHQSKLQGAWALIPVLLICLIVVKVCWKLIIV